MAKSELKPPQSKYPEQAYFDLNMEVHTKILFAVEGEVPPNQLQLDVDNLKDEWNEGATNE